MEFGVLGPLRVRDADRDHTPTAPKQRQLLSLLLLDAGNVVPASRCVAELWGGAPPSSAAATLQSYVLSLRRMLAAMPSVGSAAAARRLLETRENGYSLVVPVDALDLGRFRALARRGSALMHRDDRGASRLLGMALELWQGPALAGVPAGPVLEQQLAVLHEELLSVRTQRIDADLSLGRHRELLEELAGLAANEPSEEYVQAQYMLALHRSGRRAQALETMERLRRVLRDELGLEPSPWVENLHRAMLDDADGAADGALPRQPGPGWVTPPVP